MTPLSSLSSLSSSPPSPSSRVSCRRQVGVDHGHRLLELVAGAELHQAGAGSDLWQMAGSGVVGVPGAVRLLVVDPPEGDLAALHHAPVPALAPVVGQAPEELG